MSAESGSSAVYSGTKRQRDRELADKRQEQRVEDVLAHTTRIVDAIAGINTNYVRSLSDERLRLASQVEQLQSQHISEQLRQSEATTQLVYNNLKALRGTVSRNVKDRFIDQLRTQVDQGQSAVLDALAAHIDGALQGALTVTDTQLSAERQLSATLVQQLRSYAHTLLSTAKAANERAFKAEVDAVQKDVLIAKLRAAHLFEQNRLLRHEHEVDALMRVVAQLAEKSRFVESARAELLKAKKHVRWLEQYLDLNGIIAAAQPESSTTATVTASSSSPPLPPPPAPHPSLRQSAPHYFALKMLEHKEVTLTELVDSWQSQEGRIAAAERRCAQMEGVVKQVQHDALVVHQRFLEEKQRREIADRRITDMVRERLYPQKDSAVFEEVQRLRWAYAEVVDDAAQLAVNVKVCRDELKDAQAEVSRLTSRVAQLKRDAEADQVARTIQELRSGYAERVRSLEEASVRAQLQLTLSQQVSQQYGRVASEATAALKDAAQANAELSDVPLPAVVSAAAARRRDEAWPAAEWQQEVQRVEEQAEKLVSLSSAIKAFGLEHGELYEAQIEKLMEQWSRVRGATVVAESAQHASTEGTRNTGDSLSACHTLVSSTTTPTEESFMKLGSVVHSSKLALREALLLLVASLQSTDVERTNLVDASLSDAQYVTELVKEVTAVTQERDRLRAQVKVCRDLLEKNHVTVVERALMHDVPVEDSLNVAEAAERITVLRDQLAAAKQLCDRSLNEVKQATTEKEAVEARLAELTKAHEVLQSHAERLADKLKASLEKEGALLEETVSLQSHIAHLVRPPAAAGPLTVDKAGEGEPSATVPAPTAPSQLSALFTTLSETLQMLDSEVLALHASRDGEQHHGEEESTLESGTGVDKRGAEESSDAALLESLSRSGMMNVVTVLKETLRKAGLLKASLKSASGAQAAALCAAVSSPSAAATSAMHETDASSVIPVVPAETQRQAHAYTTAQQEARLSQMRERLQQAEKKAAEMEAANQRLIAISKSVLEKQSALKAENEQLRAQLREQTAPETTELNATATAPSTGLQAVQTETVVAAPLPFPPSTTSPAHTDVIPPPTVSALSFSAPPSGADATPSSVTNAVDNAPETTNAAEKQKTEEQHYTEVPAEQPTENGQGASENAPRLPEADNEAAPP